MPINHTIQAAGRWIWGSPLISRIKMNQNVNPPIPFLDNNGNKVDQWSFGVAYTKQDFGQHIWPALEYEGKSIFPNGFPQDFAWKFKDGDTGLDQNGKPLRDKEGYAGHMVLAISTEAFAPKCVQLMQGAYHAIVAGQTAFKCGDYVRLGLNIVGHGKKPGTQSKPGLYLNPTIVEWIGSGTEIFNGPDAMTVLGGQQFTALPPGAMPIGMAPNNMGGNAGGFPGQQQQPGPGGFNPNGGQQPQNFQQQQPPQQPVQQQQMPFNPNGGGFAPNAGQQPGNPAGNGGFNPSGIVSPSNGNPQQPQQFNPNAGNAPAPDYGFTGGGQPQQQQQFNPNGPQGFNNGGNGFPGQR